MWRVLIINAMNNDKERRVQNQSFVHILIILDIAIFLISADKKGVTGVKNQYRFNVDDGPTLNRQ